MIVTIFFVNIIVFNTILFILNRIRILCYSSILVRYDLSAFTYIFSCFIFSICISYAAL